MPGQFPENQEQDKNTLDELKGFDPFEVLQLKDQTSDVSLQKAFKQSYIQNCYSQRLDRKDLDEKECLKVKYSIECLKDPQKYPNCLKYGNPYGKITKDVQEELHDPMIFNSTQGVVHQKYVFPQIQAAELTKRHE